MADKHQEPDVLKDGSRSTNLTSSSPLIFISHDTRDAELAEMFAKLLSSVSCGMLKSFRSSDKRGAQGIEYGLEWYPHLMEKLQTSSGVVCLLTERSVDRPWILFEAGVAKGKLDTPVYGLALGISLSQANTGPFAQFQNCDDDDDSLTNLILQLLSRLPNSEPDREAVKMQVQSFNQRKREILSKLDTKPERVTESPETSVAKLFEEVKLIVQDLPSKVEGKLAESVGANRSRRARKFHRSMFDEILYMSRESDTHIGLLLLFSTFRDDVPWLYDFGREIYNAARNGHRSKAEELIRDMSRFLEMSRHHPMFEDSMQHSKESHMLMSELPRFLRHYHERVMTPKRKQPDDEIPDEG